MVPSSSRSGTGGGALRVGVPSGIDLRAEVAAVLGTGGLEIIRFDPEEDRTAPPVDVILLPADEVGLLESVLAQARKSDEPPLVIGVTAPGSTGRVPSAVVVVEEGRTLGELLDRLSARVGHQDPNGGLGKPDSGAPLESIPVGLYRVSPEGILLDGNQRLAELLGFSDIEEILGGSVSKYYPDPSDREVWIERVIDDGMLSGAEIELVRADGRRIWVRDTARLVSLPGGEDVIDGVLEDVTRERELRLQIERAKREWERTFDAVPDPVLIVNGLGAVVRANRAAVEAAGEEHPARLVGRPLAEVFPPVSPLLAKRRATGASLLVGRGEGLPGEYLATVRRFPAPESRSDWNVIVLRDVGELRRLEAEAREANERFRLLADTSLAGVYIIEGDLFVYVNPAFAGFIGYAASDIMGKLGPGDLIWPEDWPTARENLRKRFDGTVLEVRYELRLVHRDGHPVKTLAWGRRVEAGDRVYIMGTLLDITREREAMEVLSRQERLAAVGRLAAGIAHDFNNILLAISLNAEFLESSKGLSDKHTRRLGTIRGQVEKGTGIVRQVLDYARVSETDPRPIELGAVVRETMRLLRSTMREDIRVDVELEPCEHWVEADPVKIDQVVSNLVINARDAMPGGGRLTVRLASMKVEPALSAVSDRWCVLSVADTGVGMDEGTRKRIFEPFFTTKGPRRGTGLGLAQVWGIVQLYSGRIEVASAPGEGTEFTVFLPAAEPGGGGVRRESRPESDGSPWVAGHRVLLVEDEEEVRQAAAEGLREMGFTVIEAVDGEAAVRLVEGAETPFDLVITDVVMPRMGGAELVRRLRDEGWDAPVLLITGYPNDPAAESVVPEELEGEMVLKKPFTLTELVRQVRRMLPS
jgi:two-component system cell cycle sensor histidine kinase/response regulator CckA